MGNVAHEYAVTCNVYLDQIEENTTQYIMLSNIETSGGLLWLIFRPMIGCLGRL